MIIMIHFNSCRLPAESWKSYVQELQAKFAIYVPWRLQDFKLHPVVFLF